MDSVIISDYVFPVVVEFARKKNSSATIKDGKIYLRISSRLSLKEREKHINELKDWAINKIKKNPEKYLIKDNSLKHGQDFQFFGENYKIWIDKTMNKRASVVLRNKIILCRIPHDYNKEITDTVVKNLVRKVLINHQKYNVEAYVHFLNNKHFKKEISDVKIKNFKSRWGACSPKNDIELSFSLLRAPLDVIEYVILHELSHTVHRNHSKRFWARVEKVLPDYKEKKNWLNKNAENLVF